MHALIHAILSRSRAVALVLGMIFLMGAVAYSEIPREAAPDVRIPIIYVSMRLEGISPEDAERLLIRPVEKKLAAIESVKEMSSQATEGHASVMLEFEAGFDSKKALQDVREKVDEAKADLPEETDEPTVNEVNFSLFPVVNVILSGEVGERVLLRAARELRDKLEALSPVLKADIAGNREEMLELIVDPRVLEGYGLEAAQVLEFVRQNNALITAGTLDTGKGRYAVKIPGLLEEARDFYNLPIKVHENAVIRIRDVVDVRRHFKDITVRARVNGKPAIVLEVSKRSGENIIDTVRQVKEVVAAERVFWPQGIQVMYAQDQSQQIVEMVRDLQNNIILAILLVMLVVLVVMGASPAVLVALSIPGAFFLAILILNLTGVTLNIVVLFSLILSVGMLVDAAVVVCEYADRRMLEGMPRREAYAAAAVRMAWPVISSTVTTLLVFMPLLVWPGVVGQFMQYMPLTLILTLSGSLLMALVFIPTLGGWFGRPGQMTAREAAALHAAESGEFDKLGRFTRGYVAWLARFLSRPGWFVGAIFLILCGVYVGYAKFGTGVEFFPDIEPKNASVLIHARGNLSLAEQNTIMETVESRILDMKGVDVFYTRVGALNQQQDVGEDVIGIITLEFSNWHDRPSATALLTAVRKRTADIPGIQVETRKQEDGPPVGKPLHLQFSSRMPELLPAAVAMVRKKFEAMDGLVDIEDDRPIRNIEWRLEVNREKAGQQGVSVMMVGQTLKLVTNGIVADTYRPDDADDELDVVVRFPKEYRNLSELDRVRVVTAQGSVPVGLFVERVPKAQVGAVKRVDQKRVMNLKADVAEGVLADAKVRELREWTESEAFRKQWDPRVEVTFRGEDEEQKQAGEFLSRAFILALFSMMLVMVIQFNRVFHTVVVMSAVFLSTVGVLLGLLVTGQPFGIVMCGVGVISLAGIVVNNNIIFIDTFRQLREEGLDAAEALLRTGAQRLRPILLTAGTTVLGLVPMVTQLTIDFVDRDVFIGAPSSQWWTQLATTIAGGLAFATILTLFFTPCLLMLWHRGLERWERRRSGTEALRH